MQLKYPIMKTNDKRALMIGAFNLGLILFGFIFLIFNTEEYQQGEILTLIGLSGALIVTLVFLVTKYKSAMSDQ